MGGDESLKDAVRNFINEQTKERTSQAFMRISDDGALCSNFTGALIRFIL